jgi:hypothetical protein
MSDRWGNRFVDFRDWVRYNEELVLRGCFLLELGWVRNWGRELEGMNSGKVGSPFQFPESLIKLQAVLNQMMGVRQVEGLARRLFEIGRIPQFDDYSTINRRVRKLGTVLKLPKTGSFTIACDGSGMKMNDGGEYRHDLYGRKKKKWIRVKIMIDVRTKKLLDCSVDIVGKGMTEPQTAIQQIKKLLDKGFLINKFLGDGGYDTNSLFNFLEKHKIQSAIPTQENANPDPNKSKRRAQEIQDRQKKSWKKWTRKKGYGTRWNVEGHFSAVKRVFGEKTRAKTPQNQCLEVERRFWAYETMKEYATKLV